jgi:hypothetical protein
LLVCPANIRKNSRNAAFLPRDLCFIGKKVQDASIAGEAWETIQNRHKQTMKKILSEKQYDKYVKTLDLTAKNTAERIMDQQLANR